MSTVKNSYPLIYKQTVVDKYYRTTKTISHILQTFNISNGSLYNWLKADKKGILVEKKKYIRKSKYTPEIKCYIRNYVLSRTIFIMSKLLIQLKKKYKLIAQKSSVYKIMSIMNLSRTKIRKKFIYGKIRKYKTKLKAFIKQMKPIDKNNIISIDETSIDTHINNQYGWGEKGTRITKIINNARTRYTLICAISNKSIIHSKVVKNSSNAQIFKEFLEEIDKKGISNKYFLLDNARIHHATIVQEYMSKSSNKLLFNVPYSPEYNPIEHLFSQLKSLICKKTTNHIQDKLLKNIQISLNKIKKIDLQNYYKKSLSF